MGSRIKQNPETTFEVCVEVTYPRTGGTLSDPEVQRQFPEDYSDQEVLQTLTKFCFPFYVDSLTVSQVGQNFTFVLTDIDSKQRFGFCRLSSGAKSCFCILSYLPWFEVFYKLLNVLADYTTKGQESQWNELLASLHRLPIPDPGESVHLSVHSYFTVPDTRELPSIPENRNLTEYFVAVDVNNMLHLYASMLYERRILIVCSKLSTLTACIHGSAAMLYPMFWQHVYIPVLPPHLLDYCCAPMPYLIGIHLSLMEKVRTMALDDVVILNVDTNTLETPFDDLQSLPNDVISSLKNRLKKVSTTTGDGVARAFLKAQAAFFGSYRNALKIEPEEPITFCEEAFVSHYRSGAMRQFLQSATQLQLFKQFIDGRLDLLNSGEGFSDVFEEEINMGEYAGSDKLYHQWLSTVRKGSGAILNTVKTKANPAMKTVYKFAKDHAKMGIKEVKNRLKQKDITENGCTAPSEEPLPRPAPSPLVETKHREDRRPITVHFGQVRPPRPHVVKRPRSNLSGDGRRTSVPSPEHLAKPSGHYAVFLSEDSSEDERPREEGPSSGFAESFFFSAPFEWPQPYRTLKESDSAEGEAESPEQRAREPGGPVPPDRAASIDLLEDVFSGLGVEVPLQPLSQAKSLEDLRTPKELREPPGTFNYQRLELGRSERSRGLPAALKLAHPYNSLWNLGQDDMAIPSKPPAASPGNPSTLLGGSRALPCRPQNLDGTAGPGDKEEVLPPTPGSITIPRPQGRKTPELGIVPPPPAAARPTKLQAVGPALADSVERERPFPGGLPTAAPSGPPELLRPLSLAPGAPSSGPDGLLALLDPLSTAWPGSGLPPGPTAPPCGLALHPAAQLPPRRHPQPLPAAGPQPLPADGASAVHAGPALWGGPCTGAHVCARRPAAGLRLLQPAQTPARPLGPLHAQPLRPGACERPRRPPAGPGPPHRAPVQDPNVAPGPLQRQGGRGQAGAVGAAWGAPPGPGSPCPSGVQRPLRGLAAEDPAGREPGARPRLGGAAAETVGDVRVSPGPASRSAPARPAARDGRGSAVPGPATPPAATTEGRPGTPPPDTPSVGFCTREVSQSSGC